MLKPRLQCVVEALEDRTLRSVTLDSAGVIQIIGTDANDVYSVTLNTKKSRYEVVENGVYSLFPQASVTGVNAKLGLGNDSLDARYCNVKITADGEGGNDTIFGGTGDDCLMGGLDNDLVDGGEGADSVYGNGGKDNLNGGPGRDRVDGGKSNDICHGGSSNDRIIGGEGSDEIYGDGGDDLLYSGGIYKDYLFGGTGTDFAYCDGNDVLASVESCKVDLT
jgi:Ca2+-binding RTX toxin-like protein